MYVSEDLFFIMCLKDISSKASKFFFNSRQICKRVVGKMRPVAMKENNFCFISEVAKFMSLDISKIKLPSLEIKILLT